MALTDDGGIGAVMPVAPTGGFGNGLGGFGGDGWWILFLFALMFGGGWGGGFGGWGGNSFAADGAMLYPWMNQAEITTNGFQNQAIGTQLSGIQSGVQNLSTQLCNTGADIQQSLCNGFAGVNATVNGGFANAETAANARQMANMQTAFSGQTAMANGFNQLGTQTADLKYTIATENCEDRATISNGVRDLLTSGTANSQAILNAINSGIQSIKDDLCQDRLDAERRENANLRSELMYARGQASQDVQTARILAGQTAEVDALYERLNACPVGTVPVYGRQPIFTCNNGCGCGM